MPESNESKQEYQLQVGDYELIHRVDFRLNNILGALFLMLDSTNETIAISDDTWREFQQFLFARIDQIDQTKPEMLAHSDPNMKKLAQDMTVVAEQLMAIVGMVSSYLRSHDVHYLSTSIQDAHRRMQSAIRGVGMNPVYQAYKQQVLEQDLEATRTTFNFKG